MRTWITMAAALVTLGISSMSNASHCASTELVETWYKRYLHRPADACGLDNWVGQLRRGMSPAYAEACFLGSAEFYAVHGRSREGFVEGLYEDVLGRKACHKDVHYWTARLDRCGCRIKLAEEFLASARVELAATSYKKAYAEPAFVPPPAPIYRPTYEKYAPAPAFVPPPAPTYRPTFEKYVPEPTVRVDLRYRGK